MTEKMLIVFKLKKKCYASSVEFKSKEINETGVI